MRKPRKIQPTPIFNMTPITLPVSFRKLVFRLLNEPRNPTKKNHAPLLPLYIDCGWVFIAIWLDCGISLRKYVQNSRILIEIKKIPIMKKILEKLVWFLKKMYESIKKNFSDNLLIFCANFASSVFFRERKLRY